MKKLLIILLMVVTFTFFITCSDDKLENIKIYGLEGKFAYYSYKIFNELATSPMWYYDGNSIIFQYWIVEHGFDIYSIDPEGGNLTYLTSGEYGFLSDISSDGYILLFNSFEYSMNDSPIYYFKPGSEPILSELKGTSPTIYGNISQKYNIAYLYDNDNDEGNGWSIYLSDINCSKPEEIRSNGYYSRPDFNSIGDLLSYVKYREYPDKEVNPCDLCIYDMNNGEEKVIYSSNYDIHHRSFSPDGNLITFSMSGYDFNNKTEASLWLINTCGGKPWIAVNYPYKSLGSYAGIARPSWSPDGKWIVYWIACEDELWKVRVFD